MVLAFIPKARVFPFPADTATAGITAVVGGLVHAIALVDSTKMKAVTNGWCSLTPSPPSMFLFVLTLLLSRSTTTVGGFVYTTLCVDGPRRTTAAMAAVEVSVREENRW